MILRELLLTLPNGLHDGVLHHYTHHIMRNWIVMRLSVWVGDVHAEDRLEREKYEEHELTLQEIGYWSIGCIDERSIHGSYDALYVDVGEVNAADMVRWQIPQEVFDRHGIVYWMYVGPINQVVIFTCGSVLLTKVDVC